jgi:hypothetical protein
MDNKTNFRLEWKVWVNWVVATVIAFLINDGTQLFVSNGSILAFLYALVIDGLIIAFVQWLFVLRLRIPSSARWILWGTIGWTAGWIFGKFSTATMISLLIHGIIMGTIQWAFLVRKLFPKSFLWVLINAIGLPFAYGLSWFVIFPFVLGNYNGLFSGPLDSAIRGALFGTITGTTLIWLSRRPRAEMELAIANEY